MSEEIEYLQRRLPANTLGSDAPGHGGDTLHALLFHPIAGDSMAGLAPVPRVSPALSLSSLHFGIMDTTTVLDLAVVTVTSSASGTDTPGSLSDPRMGATPGRSHPCETCEQHHHNCPGHFGCIRLPHPVLNPLFITPLVAILQTLCVHCRRLRLSPYYIQTIFPPRPRAQLVRLKAISAVCARTLRCQFCRAPAVQFKQQGLCILARVAGGPQVMVPASAVFTLLVQLPDTDLLALGFDPNADNHPSSAVISVLPVLPPVSRPAMKTLNLKTGAPFVVEDTITTEYQAIMAASGVLRTAWDRTQLWSGQGGTRVPPCGQVCGDAHQH